MFRDKYQKGFISILCSSGSAPLKIWDVKTENGSVKRVVDENLKSWVYEISGKNVSTTYIACPKNKEDSLGIAMPIFTLNWKNILDFFAFEIVVKDDKKIRRRFRFSNFLNIPRNKSTFFAVCPIKTLPEGWKELRFNLTDLTKKAFCSEYVETIRVQINANCRLRGVYFSDILYEEKDIPNDCKLIKIIEPRKLYVPFQKKRKSLKQKRPASATSSDIVPWIEELKETAQTEYDIPHPSVASEEGEIYTLGSDEESEEFETDEMENLLENFENIKQETIDETYTTITNNDNDKNKTVDKEEEENEEMFGR